MGVGSRLVGRAAELATLASAITDVAAGRGRVVLLSGEAGIGKSRLGAYTVALARQHGFVTLQGQAHSLHAGLAYAPVVGAIRQHLATLEDPTELLDGLADLGRLLPDPRLPAVESLGDPDLERTRLFEAVVGLVSRIAERAPVLLFLDDLHWSDRSTVELAHYLVTVTAERPVLVLAAHRTGEPAGPLHDLAVTVRRSHRAARSPSGRWPTTRSPNWSRTWPTTRRGSSSTASRPGRRACRCSSPRWSRVGRRCGRTRCR